MTRSFSDRRMEISRMAFVDEASHVQSMLEQLQHVEPLDHAIYERASKWVEKLRKKGSGSGVEAFLHQYGLDTKEGVAIMCLAEALLRIPDSHTANRLIENTFEQGAWDTHLGKSESLFVNASSWGLLLTGKVVHLGQQDEKPSNLFAKMVDKFGDPVIREALKQAMRFIGNQFVLGETITEALSRSRSQTKKGYRFSFDILGEGARSDAQAKAYIAAYHHAIAEIGKQVGGLSIYEAPSISIKLSALHPRYQLAQSERMMAELLPRIKDIVLRAKEAGIAVSIDAEESGRLDISLMLLEALMDDKDLHGYHGLGFVVQAYQKRAPFVIDFLSALSRQYKRRIPVRLVKGAYWDSEIKWAQAQGFPGYPVFTRKEHTDVSYLLCVDRILANAGCFFPQFATHNARTISTIMSLAKEYGVKPTDFELQRLHGMGEKLHDLIVGDTPSRIYAPVGAHKDLLAYLIRRLLENGANTSFVNLLMDKERTVGEVISDPIAQTRKHGGVANSFIPLPVDLYGAARKNSMGIDFGNLAMCKELHNKMQPFLQTPLSKVAENTPQEAEAMVSKARAAYMSWAAYGVEARAGLLRDLADAIEKHRDEFMAMLSLEAGKNLPDGIAEVREAADFCRYYANQACRIMQPDILPGPTGESNVLTVHPRGVFVCISPWNFPLAIFIGQIVAALVTGNSVIAKPAEQTPRVAQLAVRLMHEVGIPKDAMQLILGAGDVGAALTSHPHIDGVVFTGSGATAQLINRTLAAKDGPIVPLIAETGGQNCMVVDSSALLEQAVDDIILSAFGSAGQRCSALRVLFVQEDIADELLHLLKGAMQELAIGDPSLLKTDIGPVIDQPAKQALAAHIDAMKREATHLATAPGSDEGNFLLPHLFEIPKLSMLTEEHFGPILHVVRFKAKQLPQVINDIHATNFCLTFGVHSRIEENTEYLLSRVRVGNYYVNRSMTGAVVGVQPFGGEGLSGTGPKAGGPHYLLRFLSERTVTINIAAIGGNIGLLSSPG